MKTKTRTNGNRTTTPALPRSSRSTARASARLSPIACTAYIVRAEIARILADSPARRPLPPCAHTTTAAIAERNAIAALARAR